MFSSFKKGFLENHVLSKPEDESKHEKQEKKNDEKNDEKKVKKNEDLEWTMESLRAEFEELKKKKGKKKSGKNEISSSQSQSQSHSSCMTFEDFVLQKLSTEELLKLNILEEVPFPLDEEEGEKDEEECEKEEDDDDPWCDKTMNWYPSVVSSYKGANEVKFRIH